MSETQKFALLKDLALLLRRYGPRTFSDLAAFLKNPQNTAELTAILETAAATRRKTFQARPSFAARQAEGSREGLRHFLLKLEKDDPEKAQMLSGFYEVLIAKNVLPTLRELRSFAQDNGLHPVASKSRDKALNPLIRDLAGRPVDDVRPMLRRVRMAERVIGDRSLERWTGVILNRQR